MKTEYLESEDFFMSNGFFKIWNYSSGKNFPIFGQYFVPALHMAHIKWSIFERSENHHTLCFQVLRLDFEKSLGPLK